MISSDNKSFCAVPFVSTMVNTDTTIRYCCMVKGVNKIKKPNGGYYTCRDDFIHEAWNSEDMRTIRINMIEGNKIQGCEVCYQQEATGRSSNRQHANNEWAWRLGEDAIAQLIEEAIDNDGHLTSDPVYLDLRLGNLCNLKCRMCNPWNSSQIVKEHADLVANSPEYGQVWEKTFGKFPITVMDDQQWFDHDILWDQVIALIPKLKKVYMTGGEPTLIKNNFKFMKACIEQGRTDIVLFFNTNCTNINKQFLELISQFKQVNINASMDGIGIINEYIRAPSDWKLISENIEKLAQTPNVNLGITPTIQVYNVFDIVNILRWVDILNSRNDKQYEKKIFIDFLVNHHPHHLSVRILDDEMRFEALKMIKEYNAINGHMHSQTRNSLNGIIGLLQQPRVDDWQEQLERFKIYTNALDSERGQSISDIDSRLAELCR